jgi:hypothetical protein
MVNLSTLHCSALMIKIRNVELLIAGKNSARVTIIALYGFSYLSFITPVKSVIQKTGIGLTENSLAV